jgi:hypothetical protein
MEEELAEPLHLAVGERDEKGTRGECCAPIDEAGSRGGGGT